MVPVLALLLIAAAVGAVGWWRFTAVPPPAVEIPVRADEMDVVCTGRVDAAGTVIALEPAQAGRVAAVLVKEGDAVKIGQEVLKINDEAAKAKLAQAEAAVAAAGLEVDAAKADADRVPGQLAAREHLLAAAAARAEGARKLFQQRIAQQSITPFGRIEQEAVEAQVRELEQMEAAERGQLEDQRKADPQHRVRLAKSKLRAAEADRDLAAKAVRDAVVTAPSDGTILRVQITPGGLMAPGSAVPAVVFAPAGPFVVRAEVDQEFLGRVKPGMTVTIQDENRIDGKTWPGRVRSVAGWVATRRTVVLDPGEVNDVRTVECVVEFDPPATDLWIGQQMRVRIKNEPRP